MTSSTATPATEREPASRVPTVWLLAADALALALFIVLGLRSHGIGAVAEVAARNAIPLAVAWVVVSLALGTYRRADLRSLVLTWAIAVPVALLARTWWVGSPTGGRIAIFVGVGLAFTLMFLAIGRAVVAVATRTRPAWRRA